MIFLAVFGFVHAAQRLRIPAPAVNGALLLGVVAFVAPIASAAPQGGEGADVEAAQHAGSDWSAGLAELATADADREERYLHC